MRATSSTCPGSQADFLGELPVQRLLGALAAADAALRKLPAARAGAAAQEYLAVVVHDHDADIGPVAFVVDVIGLAVHRREFFHSAPYVGTTRKITGRS